MAAATISRLVFMRWFIALGLLFTGPVYADEPLEGYFVYDFFVVLCPISEASLPNVQDIEPDALDPETAAVVSFYQFVVRNDNSHNNWEHICSRLAPPVCHGRRRYQPVAITRGIQYRP